MGLECDCIEKKTWQTIKRILNIITGVSGGCYIGRVLWVIVDYKMNPDLYDISAVTFNAVMSFVVGAIHIGSAVACGILAIAAWKCSNPEAPSALQVKGE